MDKKPSGFGRLRTLDDGTLLFRKNRTTPTFRLMAEQYGEIEKLYATEFFVALLLAPPVLAFFMNTLKGDFGVVWKATAAYFLLYCIINHALDQRISKRVDRICQNAVVASPEQSIVFPSFVNALRENLSSDPYRHLIGTALLFATFATVPVVIGLSMFFDMPFSGVPAIPWISKLFIGVSGLLSFGGYAYLAFEEIRRRRGTERQSSTRPSSDQDKS